MSVWRKLDLRIWSDREFRRLSRPQPNGQTLFVELIQGQHTIVIPGLLPVREAALADSLGWSLEGFREAFREVSGEAFQEGCSGASKAMAKADWEAGLIFVPGSIKHNRPQSPNVVKSWRTPWDLLPECDLKDEAFQHLKAFVEGMSEAFAEAFRDTFPEECRHPSRNQEAGSRKQEAGDPPKAPQGALWSGKFDPSRSPEVIDALRGVWSGAFPAVPPSLQVTLAGRLHEWCGMHGASSPKALLSSLGPWSRRKYQPRDKVRLLLSGDLDEALSTSDGAPTLPTEEMRSHEQGDIEL